MKRARKNFKIFRIIAMLWFIWSLLHIFPGIFSLTNALSGDITSIQFLFPETDPIGMTGDYPNEVAAILVTFGQHGFNLFWFGMVTLVCSILIWKKHDKTAGLIALIVGGLADLGALFATFMIGSIDIWGVLIFVGSFSAVLLSFRAWTYISTKRP
ncbi:MAG: hypothetical protein AAGC45_03605 [Bacteroidota bacterium]